MEKQGNTAELAGTAADQVTLPPHIEAMFGKPPVLRTESLEAYEYMRLEIARQIRPMQMIEWAWVIDLANLIWEIRRYRSAIKMILDAAFKPALKSVLHSMSDIPLIESLEASDKRESFADKWYGSATERAEVSATLAKYDLDTDAVAAHAFVVRQTQIQALETLIERAELRRDRILREISFYRETLTEGLDPLTRKLIDASPNDVSRIAQQKAA
jgi:hypothetical protein